MTIKISFITMASHSASALKQRLEATRKWPILVRRTSTVSKSNVV